MERNFIVNLNYLGRRCYINIVIIVYLFWEIFVVFI